MPRHVALTVTEREEVGRPPTSARRRAARDAAGGAGRPGRSSRGTGSPTLARLAALAALAVPVAWGLWSWRAELDAVPYLDDSSVHAQMVRFATTRLREGHLPLTSWFPYLGLGSPQFLHYQSLPAILTGTLGLGTGGDSAFRLSLYLLLALYPLPLYWSARVLGMGRPASLVTAACAPLLMSAVGVGYESKAYVWIGYGVWAQLWASWTLPLAWAWTWRAMSSRRAVVPAVVFVGLTMAFHFETGYLAVLAVGLFPFLVPSDLRARLWRAVAVGAGALVGFAWVWVPLVVEGNWASVNEVLRHGALEDGYGAKQVMAWLMQGQLLDAYRLPVVSVLAAAGLVACMARWRTQLYGRALVGTLVMSLLLSFGRTTFGSLTKVIPGSTDIFMRRFMMGIQLSALFLAGVGALALASWAWALVSRWRPSLRTWPVSAASGWRGAEPDGAHRGGWRLAALWLGGAALTVAVLAPAWTQIGSFAAANASDVGTQRKAAAVQGAEVDRLIAYVRAHGGGRVYAGMPSNWGSQFRVGFVPVFKYLESRDVDEVGYTLRTASLMTDPEYFFDEANPGDYALFGVRYTILPSGQAPPVPASLAVTAGPYALWVLPQRGYVRVVDTVGVLSADRSNVGTMSVPYLRSELPGEGRYLAVAWGGAAPAALTARGAEALTGGPGAVRAERDDLPAGEVVATVVVRRRAAVVLSASFDPGWTVTVDGRRAPLEMLAPALPAVTVGPGTHRVVFAFAGFGLYPELFALSGVALVVVVMAGVVAPERWRRRHRRGRRHRAPL